jgi:hypothetical protein
MFQLTKPSNWQTLPLYQKIKYYAKQLDESYGPYVDKIEAKRIVKEICGNDIEVAPIVRILKGPKDLQKTDMTPDCLIKAAHGSGWNIDIVKTTMRVEQAREMLESWNRIYSPGVENQYGKIQPRFYTEKKVNDYEHGITGLANTFSVRCIRGKAISFHIKRKDKFNAWILPSWQIVVQGISKSIKIPKESAKMIELAEKLANPFEFVRIDFYLDKKKRIFFSEYTFTPNGGNQFYPMPIEVELGSLWV